MDTLEYLIAGRAEVEKGWVRLHGESLEGVCAIRALGRVGVDDIDSEPCEALRAALPAGHLGIVAFNDDHRTTKADVLALYDRAILAEAVKVTADTAHAFAMVS